MTRRLTATLLIFAAVLATVALSVFSYPAVLDESASTVLAAFRDSQSAVRGSFLILALSAALLAPIAIGVGRLSLKRAVQSEVPDR